MKNPGTNIQVTGKRQAASFKGRGAIPDSGTGDLKFFWRRERGVWRLFTQ